MTGGKWSLVSRLWPEHFFIIALMLTEVPDDTSDILFLMRTDEM